MRVLVSKLHFLRPKSGIDVEKKKAGKFEVETVTGTSRFKGETMIQRHAEFSN